MKSVFTPSTPAASEKSTRTRRPDRAVYVPKARRNQTTPRSCTNLIQINVEKTNDFATGVTIVNQRSDPETYQAKGSQSKSSVNKKSANINKILKQVKLEEPNYNKDKLILESECTTNNSRNSSLIKLITIDNSDCGTNGKIDTDMAPPFNQHLLSSIKIKNVIDGSKHKTEDDKNYVEKELKKVSQDINRSDRCLMKQTFKSDLEEIGTKDGSQSRNGFNQKVTSTKADIQKYSSEEDDWESLFTESGDCLDPKMMDELIAQVDRVKIIKPNTDYEV